MPCGGKQHVRTKADSNPGNGPQDLRRISAIRLTLKQRGVRYAP
jgi:hypothetical protein